jgi:rhamnosyltransferase
VSRLEPENNIYEIVNGFVEARPEYPLIVVGDFTSNKYRDRVYGQAFNGNSSDIVFLGSIYDSDTLWMLRQHCLAYIHGHSVGGTNPSLLEAMISENLIVAHDNIFNKELCGRFARYFSNSSDLSALVTLIEKRAGEPDECRSEVYKRAISAYSWDSVTTLYDKLLGKDNRGEAAVRLETQAKVSQQTEP